MNKKALAVAISSALAMPMAAQAVSFNVSGQVNKAVMFADDGADSDIYFVDNTASNSRFRLSGSEDMGNGVTAGFRIELASEVNSNFTQTIDANGDVTNFGGGGGTSMRKSEAYFSGNFGTLTLGQGPTATDGMGDADLSNTWLADFSATTWGGVIAFRTSGAAAAASAFTAAGVTTYFDGHSRRARIRYDAPSFGPLTLSVDKQHDAWGAKAYVYTSLGGGDLSLAIGHASGDNRFGSSVIGGSASFLSSNGTNLTIGYQERDFAAVGRNTAEHFYVKLGHRWGNNAVSISYGDNSEQSANTTDANTIGLGFVHTIPKPKVELYAAYNHISLDSVAGVSFEDIDVFGLGTRVKFD